MKEKNCLDKMESSDTPCKDGNVRFTTKPLEPLYQWL